MQMTLHYFPSPLEPFPGQNMHNSEIDHMHNNLGHGALCSFYHVIIRENATGRRLWLLIGCLGDTTAGLHWLARSQRVACLVSPAVSIGQHSLCMYFAYCQQAQLQVRKTSAIGRGEALTLRPVFPECPRRARSPRCQSALVGCRGGGGQRQPIMRELPRGTHARGAAALVSTALSYWIWLPGSAMATMNQRAGNKPMLHGQAERKM